MNASERLTACECACGNLNECARKIYLLDVFIVAECILGNLDHSLINSYYFYLRGVIIRPSVYNLVLFVFLGNISKIGHNVNLT